MHRLASIGGLVAVLLAPGGCDKLHQNKPCTHNSDCPAGEVCRDQVCRAPRGSLTGAASGTAGSSRAVVITLVPADVTGLACAMGDTVAGLECAYAEESGSPKASADPKTSATVLQPVTTAGHDNVLVAGLWTQAAVRDHLAKVGATSPSRFQAHCAFRQQGTAGKASARWATGEAWHRADGWPLGVVTDCQVK